MWLGGITRLEMMKECLGASNDAGKTFGNKINLCNTTNSESIDAEIAVEGTNVILTWWERNQTNNDSYENKHWRRIFGPLLKLTTNGTLSTR